MNFIYSNNYINKNIYKVFSQYFFYNLYYKIKSFMNKATLDINYSNLNYLEYFNSYFFYLKDDKFDGNIKFLNKNVILKFRIKGDNIIIKFNNIVVNSNSFCLNLDNNDNFEIFIHNDINKSNRCRLVLFDLYICSNVEYKSLLNSIVLFNNDLTNKNLISYEEINVVCGNYSNYYSLFDSTRDNVYFEKDIINQQFDLIEINNKKNTTFNNLTSINRNYIDFVASKISDGIIINRKQLKKLFPKIIIEDNESNILIKHEGENYLLKEFISKYLKENDEENYLINKIKIIDKKLTNCELLILVHIGNSEIGYKIVKKLVNIKDNKKNDFVYAFNFNNDLDEVFRNRMFVTIKKYFGKYIISETNNFGNDIIPSLLLYNYIENIENIENKYILKLQTKRAVNFLEENINVLINNNISELINILDNNLQIDSFGTFKYLMKMDIYNSEIITKSLKNNNLYFFDDFSDIKYISDLYYEIALDKIAQIKKFIPEKFNYSNYINFDTTIDTSKNLKYFKIDLIERYLKYGFKLNVNVNRNEQPYNFFGGTMFLCRKKVFDNILKNNFHLIKASIINNFYYDNNIFFEKSPIHSLERLFGYGYKNKEIMEYKGQSNILLSYACHISSENDIHLINYHLELFLKNNFISTLIVGFSSSISDDLISEKIIKNNKIILKKYNNVGLDMYKHFNNLNNIKYDEYEYVFFINDSIIFIKDIDYIFSYVRFNNYYDFLSLLNSYERKLHYPSFFWIMKPNIVSNFLKVYSKNFKIIIKNKRKLIDIIEIGLTNKLKDKFRCISFYNINSGYDRNIHFDNKFYEFLEKTGYPIIKKTLLYYYLTPQLNKLYGESQLSIIDFFKKIEKKIYDFNYKDYLELNQDITNFSEEQCYKHYFNSGFYEHRKCDKNNVKIYNDIMISFLSNNKNYNYEKFKKFI